jgi:hypothetical protein
MRDEFEQVFNLYYLRPFLFVADLERVIFYLETVVVAHSYNSLTL